MIQAKELVESLHIEPGDLLLVASDVKKLLWLALREGKEFSLDEFIDELQEKIGQEGTLAFPCFNWDFCKGMAWSYHNTASHTGALSTIALNRKDFIRTKHPIYSFAVWGKYANRLFAMENRNSFVGDTPFDFLYKNNGKMITIDVNLTDCYTFVHYVEEKMGVPYRFLKTFSGKYIDENGDESTREYSMFVRYLDRKVETDFSGLERQLIEKHYMTVDNIDDVIVRNVGFVDTFNVVEEDIKNKQYQMIVQLD